MKQPEVNEARYRQLAALAASAASSIGPAQVDPDIADEMGAFDEPALNLDEALDSHFDGEDPTASEEGLENG